MCAQLTSDLLLSQLAAENVERQVIDQDSLNRAKLEFCRIHQLNRMPRNSEILGALPADVREKFGQVIRLKKVRSISGVNVMRYEFATGMPARPLCLLPDGERIPYELHVWGAGGYAGASGWL